MGPADDRVKLNQSVRKAVAILRATADDGNANVSSLARATGLPRATALRLIQTLEQEGFVLRMPGDERVLLGPELLRLARDSDELLLLREVSRPIVADLVESLRETATVSIVAQDGGLDVAYQVDTPHQLRPRSWIGQRFALHSSASGKVLLASYSEERLERFLQEPLTRFTPATITAPEELRAELQRIRERRYAHTIDEDEEGLTGVAAGVYRQDGELLGVITASGPTQRLDGQRVQKAIEQVVQAAGRVEALLRRGRDKQQDKQFAAPPEE